MPTMKRADFRFFHRLRVRWAEVDMQKIVFNAHYLMYFDTAITEYWRALALPMEEVFARLGGELYVKKATVEFNASAQMDDLIDVALRCERIGNSSLTLQWAAWCQGRLIVTGEVVYVHTSLATGRSSPGPDSLRAQLDAWEQALCFVSIGTVQSRKAARARPVADSYVSTLDPQKGVVPGF